MKKTTDEELNAWRYRFPSATVSWRLYGNESLCQQYVGAATNLLYRTKNRMQLGQLNSLQSTRRFNDGTIIIVNSFYGQDIVSIMAGGGVLISQSYPVILTYQQLYSESFPQYLLFDGFDFHYYIDITDVMEVHVFKFAKIIEADALWGAIVCYPEIGNNIPIIKFHLTKIAKVDDKYVTHTISTLIDVALDGTEIYKDIVYKKVNFDHVEESISVPSSDLAPASECSLSFPSGFHLEYPQTMDSAPGVYVVNGDVFLYSDSGENIRSLYSEITFQKMKISLGIRFTWGYEFFIYHPSAGLEGPINYSRHYIADYDGVSWKVHDIWKSALVTVYLVWVGVEVGEYGHLVSVLDADGQPAEGSVLSYIPLYSNDLTSCSGFFVQYAYGPWVVPVPGAQNPMWSWYNNYGDFGLPGDQYKEYVFFTSANYTENWRSFIPDPEGDPPSPYYHYPLVNLGGGKISKATGFPAVTSNGKAIYFINGVFYSDDEDIISESGGIITQRYGDELPVARKMFGIQCGISGERQVVGENEYTKAIFKHRSGAFPDLVKFYTANPSIQDFGFLKNSIT